MIRCGDYDMRWLSITVIFIGNENCDLSTGLDADIWRILGEDAPNPMRTIDFGDFADLDGSGVNIYRSAGS